MQHNRLYSLPVRALLSCLLVFVSLVPLAAFELGLDMGFSRNGMILGGEELDGGPVLNNLEAKAYIGLSARQKISEKVMLGSKLIYNRRDFGIVNNDMTASAGYFDLMMHPVIRIYPVQLYGGPTLAFNLNSTSSGLDPWHDEEEVEEFAGLIPGMHVGIRFPDDYRIPVAFDLSYSRDFVPYSEAMGRDKYQQRMNLGVVLKLMNRSNRLEGLWWGLSKFPTKITSSQGLMVSTEKENFVFAYNPTFEMTKRFGPVTVGGDISLPAGSIMLEEDFGMLLSVLAGPHLGIKLSFLEVYAKRSWGVSGVFLFAEDHPDSGLYPAMAQQYGLRWHLSRDLSLDTYYRLQNYIRDEEIGTYGLGVNFDTDL